MKCLLLLNHVDPTLATFQPSGIYEYYVPGGSLVKPLDANTLMYFRCLSVLEFQFAPTDPSAPLAPPETVNPAYSLALSSDSVKYALSVSNLTYIVFVLLLVILIGNAFVT